MLFSKDNLSTADDNDSGEELVLPNPTMLIIISPLISQ